MKVLLLANYLNDEQESMQRFAALMGRGLTQAGHLRAILSRDQIAFWEVDRVRGQVRVFSALT